MKKKRVGKGAHKIGMIKIKYKQRIRIKMDCKYLL